MCICVSAVHKSACTRVRSRTFTDRCVCVCVCACVCIGVCRILRFRLCFRFSSWLLLSCTHTHINAHAPAFYINTRRARDARARAHAHARTIRRHDSDAGVLPHTRLPRGWHVLRTGWQGGFLSRERGWIQRGIQAAPAAQSADEGPAIALPPGVGRPAGQLPAVAHQYLRTGERHAWPSVEHESRSWSQRSGHGVP